MKHVQLLILALLFAGVSIASANEAPIILNASTQQGVTSVDWQHTADIDDIIGYSVHGYGPIGNGAMGVFEMAAGPSSSFFQESEGDTHLFSTSYQHAHNIPKKVYVYAVFENGDSVRGEYHAVKVDPVDQTLEFHAPNAIVEAGSEYSFMPQLPFKKDIDVTFELETAPNGMTVDANTGLVEWTPSESDRGQTFAVVMTVSYVEGISSFTTEWLLTVRGCMSVLAIRVHDEFEEPVKSGVITVWRIAPGSHNQAEIVSTENVTSEYYTTHVEAGTYFVEFSDGQVYEDVWYENAGSFLKATPITVHCNSDSTTIAFQTHSKEVEDYVTYFGQVIQKENAQQGTVEVEFIGFDPKLPPSERLQNARYFSTLVHLTPLGTTTYSIDVPAHLLYYALVRSTPNGGLDITTEYYLEATSINEAKVIESNNTSIDFTPEIQVNGSAGFMGFVEGIGGGPLDCKVVATRLSREKGGVQFERFETLTLSDSGVFVFEQIPAGDYVIQAIPNNSAYVPGYYSEAMNNLAVQHWQDATVVTVGAAFIRTPHLIRLEEQTIRSGHEDRTVFGGVGAKVGSVKSDGDVILVSDPVVGAIVVARGAGLIAFAETDSEGLYTINNLESGDFELSVEAPGYEAYVTHINIDPQGIGTEKNVELSESVLDVEHESALHSSVELKGNILEIEAAADIENVAVVSLHGDVVLENSASMLDISALASGTYIVIVKILGQTDNHKIQVVR